MAKVVVCVVGSGFFDISEVIARVLSACEEPALPTLDAIYIPEVISCVPESFERPVERRPWTSKRGRSSTKCSQWRDCVHAVPKRCRT